MFSFSSLPASWLDCWAWMAEDSWIPKRSRVGQKMRGAKMNGAAVCVCVGGGRETL